MKFFIEDVLVTYPFNVIYPEQIQLMYVIKKIFDKKGHGIMGIPPGIGYSITILCFFISYEFLLTKKKKLFYCFRNELESPSIMEQLKIFQKKFNRILGFKKKKFNSQILCYFGKKDLCVEPRLKIENNYDEIEDFCKSLIFFEKYQEKTGKKYFLKKKTNFSYFYNLENKCFFFENFVKERKWEEEDGEIWTMKKLRNLGIRRKICPFFLSRDLLINSNIVIGSFKNFFFSDFLEKNDDINKSSFLIFEDIYDIESLGFFFFSFKINSLILYDSQRSIFWLKKKFFSYQKKMMKRKFFNDQIFPNLHSWSKFKKKKITENLLIQKNKILKIFKNFLIVDLKKKSTKRTYDIFLLIQDLIDFFVIELRKKFWWKWNAKEFLCNVFKHVSKLNVSIKTLKCLTYSLDFVFSSLGIISYRKFSGLLRLIEFMRILTENTETLNYNFKVFFSPETQKFPFTKEPVFSFSFLETSFFLKNIFENYQSVVFCSPNTSEMNFFFFILDSKPFIFGNFLNFWRKKNIFSLNFKFDQNNLENEKENSKNKNFLRKTIGFLNKIIGGSFEGVVILFPSFDYLKSISEEWDKISFSNICMKKRKVFFENMFFEKNISMLEEFKICCDIGTRAVFFGIKGGILEASNLKLHYCRNLIIIDPISWKKEKFFKFFGQNCFFFEKAMFKKYENFFFMKNFGLLLKIFFPSKKDFGSFIIIDGEKSLFYENLIEKFGKFPIFHEKNRKIDEILEKRKIFVKQISSNPS